MIIQKRKKNKFMDTMDFKCIIYNVILLSQPQYLNKTIPTY
jgi:hypothetical protein